MIDKRDDYKFLANLETVEIDGYTMPRRQGEAKTIVRGEDLAFLYEACRTHCNAFLQIRFYKPDGTSEVVSNRDYSLDKKAYTNYISSSAFSDMIAPFQKLISRHAAEGRIRAMSSPLIRPASIFATDRQSYEGDDPFDAIYGPFVINDSAEYPSIYNLLKRSVIESNFEKAQKIKMLNIQLPYAYPNINKYDIVKLGDGKGEIGGVSWGYEMENIYPPDEYGYKGRALSCYSAPGDDLVATVEESSDEDIRASDHVAFATFVATYTDTRLAESKYYNVVAPLRLIRTPIGITYDVRYYGGRSFVDAVASQTIGRLPTASIPKSWSDVRRVVFYLSLRSIDVFCLPAPRTSVF